MDLDGGDFEGLKCGGGESFSAFFGVDQTGRRLSHCRIVALVDNKSLACTSRTRDED